MISVILPTFNESHNIQLIISSLSKSLSGVPHEIIVVDDDSPDLTWQRVEELKHPYPFLRLVRRVGKRGLSSAVVDGFKVAVGDALIVMDADLSHDCQLIPKMSRLILDGDYECVVGSRRIYGGGEEGSWPFYRRFLSYFATVLTQFFLGVHVQDPMSGFFGISKQKYKEIENQLRPRGYKILLEILACTPDIRTLELPYIFKNREKGKSKLSVGVLFHFIVQICRLSKNHFKKVLHSSHS